MTNTRKGRLFAGVDAKGKWVRRATPIPAQQKTVSMIVDENQNPICQVATVPGQWINPKKYLKRRNMI